MEILSGISSVCTILLFIGYIRYKYTLCKIIYDLNELFKTTDETSMLKYFFNNIFTSLSELAYQRDVYVKTAIQDGCFIVDLEYTNKGKFSIKGTELNNSIIELNRRQGKNINWNEIRKIINEIRANGTL